MTGRVHIVRGASHYRLLFIPGGPNRHLIEGEDALRDFLLTDLGILPEVTETALNELGTSGRYTFDEREVLMSELPRRWFDRNIFWGESRSDVVPAALPRAMEESGVARSTGSSSATRTSSSSTPSRPISRGVAASSSPTRTRKATP